MTTVEGLASVKGRPVEEQAKFADEAVLGALLLMEKAGVPFAVILDRLSTLLAVHSATSCGSAHTAAQFRRMADNIDAGALHKITGEGRRH